ncbi:putative DNA-directed DNA polymerase transcription factor Hap3/NF-YB family [Rosa chinensis]|uniref:Putative DNA-directed DNA polymerase transcription factor Hap3/NF-YB family n=1 Tax=Rosa chinensis TaxID=74649 RepID=A0A2P6QDP3_ROSCH|nr:DNA polymerase epsilon subunit 3 [Rosa chinensis]PRQ32291.1 putative DNA-directed DNA polymerase transcription factor Hap3/NF-YB family [Rosa chinensis]
METAELPKTIVRRVVKDKLSECSKGDGDLNVHKEALTAFSESARIFIHYLSATANDICKGSKRQTINGDDVLKALEDIEFPEFVEPLKASLEGLREKNAGKKAGTSKAKEAKTKEAKTKEVKKKRKLEEPPPKEEEEEEEENQDEDGGDGASESSSKE